jgi:uncharacterized protein YbcI
MNQPKRTIGQRIARAARAFEMRRTQQSHKWVAVFMNEETMVIALHSILTESEKALARSPAGAAQVQEFHVRLFATLSATLRRKIKSITGLEVHDVTAEIDPTGCSVVQLLTTDTVGEEFLLVSGGPGRTRSARLAGR